MIQERTFFYFSKFGVSSCEKEGESIVESFSAFFQNLYRKFLLEHFKLKQKNSSDILDLYIYLTFLINLIIYYFFNNFIL
jgi:hypothetical protein